MANAIFTMIYTLGMIKNEIKQEESTKYTNNATNKLRYGRFRANINTQCVITLRNILVANVINIVFFLVTSKVIEENPVVLTSLFLLITKSYKILQKYIFVRMVKIILK